MSALLETVQAARELRDRADAAFRTAVVRARSRHSLAETARAAGMTRAGVQHVVRRADNPRPKHLRKGKT